MRISHRTPQRTAVNTSRPAASAASASMTTKMRTMLGYRHRREFLFRAQAGYSQSGY